jgi:hypothetical protein
MSRELQQLADARAVRRKEQNGKPEAPSVPFEQTLDAAGLG